MNQVADVIATAVALALSLTACSDKTPPGGAVSTNAAPAAPTASAAPLAPASAPASKALPDADGYDVAKMDFKTPPAVLSNERHNGAFASGSALNLEAALKPLDPAPVKEIRLDTTHKIIEIAPGVKFSAWTFGDQVPGPVGRARVGDRIKFTMSNRSDEAVAGMRMTTAPMMHSMDYHAAMVSPQDK